MTTSEKIITLEQSEELKNSKIVEDFYFEIPTKNFILDLNHEYKNTRVIWHYNKNWILMKTILNKECKKKGVQDKHIPFIEDTVDHNYNSISSTQANFNDYNDDDDERSGESGGSGGNKQTTAEILVSLAMENLELFKTEFNIPYARIKINNHYEIMKIKGGNFESYLAKLYYDNCGKKVANAESVSNAKNTLFSIALQEGKTIPLHLRIAWSNPETKDSIYYDMTDDERRCVKITKGEGWKIVENQDEKFFEKFGHQSPQLEPLHEYDPDIFDKFINSLNISDKTEDNKIIIKVWIVSLLIPVIPIPMLLPLGPEGSAKTTLQKKIQKLIDPTSYDPFSINNDKTQFIQQLSHHFLCFYDNVKYEPKWLSDETCRAITGGSFSKRGLWTDDEDIPYRYKKRMSFSGINNIFHQPDAQDRSITVDLIKLDETERITEEQIELEFKQQIPQLLGYIFDVVAKALEIKDSISLVKKPRMVDFGVWGEAIARAMGYNPLEFIDAYFENIAKRKIDIIENDPYMTALSKFIDYDTRSWTSQLLPFNEALKESAEANNIDTSGFPKTKAGISSRLRKATASMIDGLGVWITVTRIKSGVPKNSKLRNTAIVRIWKKTSTPSTPPHQPNDEGNNDSRCGGDLESGDETSTPLHQDSQIRAQNDEVWRSGESGALFSNLLVSESDLKDPNGFQYDPEIINNIDKFVNSDRWFCKNCTMKDDKWFMMKHICKHNQKKKC